MRLTNRRIKMRSEAGEQAIRDLIERHQDEFMVLIARYEYEIKMYGGILQ
jgi:hypothetical protein